MNQSAASFRRAVRVFAWIACVLASTVLAVQQSNVDGNGIIVGVVVDENHLPVSSTRIPGETHRPVRAYGCRSCRTRIRLTGGLTVC